MNLFWNAISSLPFHALTQKRVRIMVVRRRRPVVPGSFITACSALCPRPSPGWGLNSEENTFIPSSQTIHRYETWELFACNYSPSTKCCQSLHGALMQWRTLSRERLLGETTSSFLLTARLVGSSQRGWRHSCHEVLTLTSALLKLSKISIIYLFLSSILSLFAFVVHCISVWLGGKRVSLSFGII